MQRPKDMFAGWMDGRLKPNGYVCRIIDASEKKDYYELVLDVAEGEYKDYGENMERYQDKPFGYLKYCINLYDDAKLDKLLTVLRISNDGFEPEQFDYDIRNLRGLMLGVVVGNKVTKSKQGRPYLKHYVFYVTRTDFIKAKQFRLPKIKQEDADTYNKLVNPHGLGWEDEIGDD